MEEREDTFPRLLMHHAKVRPDHPATREKDLGIWQTWTWRQVADEVRALACGLAAQGFKRGMHLAIIGDNRPRLYWSMLAAQALGGVAVPMYQDAPAADFVYVMTGFAPNTDLLRAAGVPVDETTGIPAHDPDTLETSVPNLFIAGVVVAGFDANKVFIENGRYHGDKIVARLLGKATPPEPKLSAELDT